MSRRQQFVHCVYEICSDDTHTLHNLRPSLQYQFPRHNIKWCDASNRIKRYLCKIRVVYIITKCTIMLKKEERFLHGSEINTESGMQPRCSIVHGELKAVAFPDSKVRGGGPMLAPCTLLSGLVSFPWRRQEMEKHSVLLTLATPSAAGGFPP